MRIGIKLEDGRFDGVDMRRPENGNPGVGGTTYEEILLARSLQLYCGDGDIEVILYHTNDKNLLPEGIREHRVNALQEIPRAAKADGVDLLIFSCGRREAWYRELEQLQIPCVAWAHCYLNCYEVKYLRKYDCVKRIVFVGREQYSAYIADDIIEKSSFIYNMIGDVQAVEKIRPKKKQVVFVGSIDYYKGFHVLAKAWKGILKEVPDATLEVLGSGKLYGRNTQLGKLGIAKKSYERRLYKHITDGNGKILESIHFRGIVGEDKDQYIKQSMAGVVNPAGKPETFCLSAVDMEVNRVPVCTVGKYGLLDTVMPGETGLFSNTVKQLRNNIVELLKNEEMAYRYGDQAYEYVKRFQAENLIDGWVQLFHEVRDGAAPQYVPPVARKNDALGKIKRWIRSLRMGHGLRWLPSFVFFDFAFYGTWRVFIRDTLYHFLPPPEPTQD